MDRKAFEANVSDFCKLWLCGYIDDYSIEYTVYEDSPDSIEACVSTKGPGDRSYAITLIIHPDREGDIAIEGDGHYVEADGAGLYSWLWLETMRREDEANENRENEDA